LTIYRDVFGQSSLEEQKQLVDRYVECVKTLIKHGAYETGFALLDNFGLNSSGQTVLLDFGELTFVKEVALDSAHKQPWATDRGGVKVLEGEVLDYYLSRMNVEITPEFVDREWEANGERK
jgi:aminoglycoside/choline kinase family phosphotransferase